MLPRGLPIKTIFDRKERVMRRFAETRHGIDRRTLLAGAAALTISSNTASANEFPERPIKLVVPFGAGSIADIIARRTSEKASPLLGQSIFIENRPGAGGSIGAAAVATAAPDGYTLCLGTVASHSIAAAIVPRLPYDLLTDFRPIALLVSTWNLIVVNRAVPAQTLTEYLEHARKKGHSLYVSGGIATTTHLIPELIRARHNAPLEHVPAADVGKAFTDVLAGTVDMMCYPALALQPHIDSGGVRPLAVASQRRVGSLPNVPTVVEALGSNEFDLSSWFGVFSPGKTPDAIVNRLSSAFVTAVLSIRDDLAKLGAEAQGWAPDRFDPFFRSEIPRWKEVVRVTGVAQAR
jgi:tripartite-type tricarboxylate transporter receptor subunit TctC